MMIIERGNTKVCLCQETLAVTVEKDQTRWEWTDGFQPELICKEGRFSFLDAVTITHETYTMGVGIGIRSCFEGFEKDGVTYPYAFETLIWMEDTTEQVYFEWVPLKEEGLQVEKVLWPGQMAFEEKKDSWYTLLTHQQGILIPNDWEIPLSAIPFAGFFETAGGYMPWFGQVKDRQGYIAICTTPWNAGYYAEHPAGGPYTHVGVYFAPSLGKMEYRRVMRYTFLNDCDYNDLCKEYRSYVNEQGRLRTLEEKAARTPSVNDLIGCAFVHKGIKTQVQHNSDFFDPENPEKNNHLTTFAQRTKEIRELHELGVEKLYLHLDGWAQPGYDNQHPDYLPACKEAGGWEDMKELADTMHECGYMFGIHDQYRDFYKAAPSFDENYACRLPDGSIPEHQRWAGGPQSYLCATQAPYYVKRNFTEIKKHGIRLDGAYLDVFTCNEGDECDNPEHRMTRRECYEFRGRCFEYLLSQGILPSSEEVSDWAVPSLVFCHYAPYDFMMKKPGTPKEGVPALFLPNLFSAFGTFLLRQFFMSLPKELEEAAIVDGCGRFRIFAQIMLPLIKPGIVAMSIFTIKFAWNDFMWPLIVNTSMNKMTLGPALSTLQGQYTTEYPMQMAGAVLAVLPLVVMFFIFQKQFIEGVAQSGIKG